jgi:hypothetical protein
MKTRRRKMKRSKVGIFALMAFGMCATVASATPALYDWSFNIDGTLSEIGWGDPIPTGVDVSSFNDSTGLGTITYTSSLLGSNSFLAFFDHEIDEASNTWWNETGAVTGAAAADQSWEIDEPGYYDGDIYENFLADTLDNGIGTSIYGDTSFPDDVSMAMGWDFTLAAGEAAVITLTLSETLPGSGFYLTHWDPDSDSGFYFSSSLDISDNGGGDPVPEPATMLLFGTGLAGLFGYSRKKRA